MKLLVSVIVSLVIGGFIGYSVHKPTVQYAGGLNVHQASDRGGLTLDH